MKALIDRAPSGRTSSVAFAASAVVLTLAFALLADVRPIAQWSLLDLTGEGALALLAGAWCLVVLRSRPGGRVTALLGGGLALLALAAWADALDELFRLRPAGEWLGAAESLLAPLGIAVLSVGLVSWRNEQQVLGEQLGGRERGHRDHRSFDRLTRLADAGYLRAQLDTELARSDGRPCSVAMFTLESRLAVEHRHGARAAARLLQTIVQQLLLNLRPDDLLCRYAGDRLVLLMPATPPDDARRRADHLRTMCEAMRVHGGREGQVLPVSLPFACRVAEADAQATLTALGRACEAMGPGQPAVA